MLSIFTTTVPLVAAAELTVKLSPSKSVSLSNTSIVIAMSSLVVAISSVAIGLSSTAITLTSTLAVSINLPSVTL